MSVTTVGLWLLSVRYEIACCGCGSTFLSGIAATPESTVFAARKAGWSLKAGTARCDKCRKEKPRKRTKPTTPSTSEGEEQ